MTSTPSTNTARVLDAPAVVARSSTRAQVPTGSATPDDQVVRETSLRSLSRPLLSCCRVTSALPAASRSRTREVTPEAGRLTTRAPSEVTVVPGLPGTTARRYEGPPETLFRSAAQLPVRGPDAVTDTA